MSLCLGPYIDDLQKWASGVDQIQLRTDGLLCSFLLHQSHWHRVVFSACTQVSIIFFSLSLLCRASQEFSPLTAPGTCGIPLRLENTTPATLYLGTTRLVLGASVSCVYELHQSVVHVVEELYKQYSSFGL